MTDGRHVVPDAPSVQPAWQRFTRDGFDLKRHPFSMLSLGDLGWIQIANFVIVGLLFTACAIGMRRVLHPGRGGTWGPLLIGAFGVFSGDFRIVAVAIVIGWAWGLTHCSSASRRPAAPNVITKTLGSA